MRTPAEIQAAIDSLTTTADHYSNDIAEAQRGLQEIKERIWEEERELAEATRLSSEEYMRQLRQFALSLAPGPFSVRTGVDGSINVTELLAMRSDGLVYVEIDRALIIDTIKAAGGNPDLVAGKALWTLLWTPVARVDDEGDIILHATSGERVQFGRDDVSEG